MSVSAIPTTSATSDVESTDRKSTRLNSSHSQISYAVFCLKKKTAHGHHRVNTPNGQWSSAHHYVPPVTLPCLAPASVPTRPSAIVRILLRTPASYLLYYQR